MVERAAGLAKDSHARTRHAAVLVRDGSMVAWGTNGVPFPGEDHCYCKYPEFGVHDNCRTHAEQRAINLAREGDGWKMLQGSKLIYVRLEADNSSAAGPAFLRSLQPPGAVPGDHGMDLRAFRRAGRVLRGGLRRHRPAPLVRITPFRR